MAKFVSNIKQVKASIKSTAADYDKRTKRTHNRIAGAAKQNIRNNIAAKPGGVFPGYAITGALARKVVATRPRKQNGYISTVQIALTGKQRLYALIHEFGGVIKAKNAPYLVFFIPGVGWRRAKQVKITKKQYFAKGIAKTRQEWNVQRVKQNF